MKTIQTLFDTESVKEKPFKSPSSKLRTALLSDLRESIYKFKIRYNRVFYGKIKTFPKDISKEDWLRIAEQIWVEKGMEGKISTDPYTHKKIKLKLLDPIKANQ
jgi:hypothetical protein